MIWTAGGNLIFERCKTNPKVQWIQQSLTCEIANLDSSRNEPSPKNGHFGASRYSTHCEGRAPAVHRSRGDLSPLFSNASGLRALPAGCARVIFSGGKPFDRVR